MPESRYTYLLNKTWIGTESDKESRIITIRMFSYKKELIYTEQELPYLKLDMFLIYF